MAEKNDETTPDASAELNQQVGALQAKLEAQAEQIKEDVKTKTLPTRIGIALKAPVTKATVTQIPSLTVGTQPMI